MLNDLKNLEENIDDFFKETELWSTEIIHQPEYAVTLSTEVTAAAQQASQGPERLRALTRSLQKKRLRFMRSGKWSAPDFPRLRLEAQNHYEPIVNIPDGIPQDCSEEELGYTGENTYNHIEGDREATPYDAFPCPPPDTGLLRWQQREKQSQNSPNPAIGSEYTYTTDIGSHTRMRLQQNPGPGRSAQRWLPGDLSHPTPPQAPSLMLDLFVHDNAFNDEPDKCEDNHNAGRDHCRQSDPREPPRNPEQGLANRKTKRVLQKRNKHPNRTDLPRRSQRLQEKGTGTPGCWAGSHSSRRIRPSRVTKRKTG